MSDKKRPKTKPTGFPVDLNKVVKLPKADVVPLDRIAAWRVKSCYIQERSRWETFKAGHTVMYKPPKSYDGLRAITVDGEVELQRSKSSVWFKLVNWCQHNDANPEEYVRVAFSSLPMSVSAPEPIQLMSNKYLEKWKSVSVTIPEVLTRKLQAEQRIASTHFVYRRTIYKEKHQFALRCVLTNADLELSPLFRYCVAVDTNTPDMQPIILKFFAEAVLQFECYREAYTSAWASVLPPKFSNQSKLAYPIVLSRIGLGSAGNENDAQ